MPHEKLGTNDVADADINACVVLHQQSRKIAHNVHTFLKKLSFDEERAKMDFSRKGELTVQACGIGIITDL
jgi:hypothetical protein